MFLNRRPARTVDPVDLPRHPGIEALGRSQPQNGKRAQDRRKTGPRRRSTDTNLVRFTLPDLFADATSRKRLIYRVFDASPTTTSGF